VEGARDPISVGRFRLAIVLAISIRRLQSVLNPPIKNIHRKASLFNSFQIHNEVNALRPAKRIHGGTPFIEKIPARTPASVKSSMLMEYPDRLDIIRSWDGDSAVTNPFPAL
jgi:hypothetical protein